MQENIVTAKNKKKAYALTRHSLSLFLTVMLISICLLVIDLVTAYCGNNRFGALACVGAVISTATCIAFRNDLRLVLCRAILQDDGIHIMNLNREVVFLSWSDCKMICIEKYCTAGHIYDKYWICFSKDRVRHFNFKKWPPPYPNSDCVFIAYSEAAWDDIILHVNKKIYENALLESRTID